MADFNTVLKKAMTSFEAGKSPADLAIGTITSIDPINIRISNDMPDIPEVALLFTDSVVEKKLVMKSHLHYINSLSHDHQYVDYTSPTSSRVATTDAALEGTYPTLERTQVGTFYLNGQELQVIGTEDDTEVTIVVNNPLNVGDKVLMLRVHNGQRFIVLSRVYTNISRTLE